MRTLKRNKQTMRYVLYSEKTPVYATDDDGNILYDTIDGVEVPVETGDYQDGYSDPVAFKANIVFAGGQAEAEAYGMDVGAYTHKMVTMRKDLPITETSLIFRESEPEYKDGVLVDTSADFRVIRCADSLNEDVYLLKQITK